MPAPPMTAVALQAVLDSLIALGDECVAARVAAEQATVTKDARLKELTDAMRAVLRYAEDTVDYDDAQLTLLGWGGKAAPTALGTPGQVRTLEIVSQGEGWVCLDWKSPSAGGDVASYKVERREWPAVDWMTITFVMETEATLHNQERSKNWEYRVVAVNKAGEGVPSSTVAEVIQENWGKERAWPYHT